MSFRIVSDSSSNVLSMGDANYTTVPLKVVADKEYIDDTSLDLLAMVEGLRTYKGKSGSSCPNMGEWLDAFGDAEEIFCITISRNLSGSYNAAMQAAASYMEENPGRKVFVLDSLSAGPELAMLAEKILQCEAEGLDFEATKQKVLEYHNYVHTAFCLESMLNLARNGRVPMAVAKIAGMLGIRVVGTAQDGQVTPVHKPRGAKKATQTIVEILKERGFKDGNILRVAHCFGEEPALALRDAILEEYPNTRFILETTGALCSFYAEAGGLMIGFEGAFNTENDNAKYYQ